MCMLMPEDRDPAPSLNKLHQSLTLRISELGSAMGETMSELNRPLLTNVPFHFIYFNYDTLSLRTSLKSVAQHPGDGLDAITFTKEINKWFILVCLIVTNFRAVYQSFDKFVERNDNSAHLDLKVNENLWIGFKRYNQRLLIVFIPNAANSAPGDMHNYFESILQSHFEHILLT